MSEYSIQQQKIIDQYRQNNNLGYVISDDAVVSIMQKEMLSTGKIYPGFENLVDSNYSKPLSSNEQLSLFGLNAGNQNLYPGISIEHTGSTIQATEAQLYAINFLKEITTQADTNVKEREKEAGPISAIVNFFQEKFNEEYSKSHVKGEITKTKADLILLEAAANGESLDYGFWVDPTKQSFEKTFKDRRGVDFSEENINNCIQKAHEFAQIKTIYDMINTVKESLSATTIGDVKSQMNPQKSTAAIIKAFQMSGINSVSEINKTLADIENQYKNHPDIMKYGGNFRLEKNNKGQYVIMRTTPNGRNVEATNEELKIIASEMGACLDKTFTQALGGEYTEDTTPEEIKLLAEETFNKYQKEYEDSFKKAFGGKDLKILSEEYIHQQQQGVAYFEMGLNMLGMALMIVPGGAAATTGWALKAANGLSSGSKIVKGLQVADKVAKGMQGAQKIAAPFVMAGMTLRPTELIEQIFSENGMSPEEWSNWGKSVLQNTIYMTVGMGVSKLAESGAALYKTKALVETLKQSGKNADEIALMVKSNPVKFPSDIVKSFKKIDNLAKALQVSQEAALDIGSTILLNKVMNNGDVLPIDVINSITFAISGGVLQKQFQHLNTESKIKYIHDTFKEYGISEGDAKNILKAMDDISEGNLNAQKANTANGTEAGIPKGMIREEEVIIQNAKTENPAEIISDKVKEQWLQDGLNTEEPKFEPIDLYNLDPYAGLKEALPEVNGEVTSLILTGKLKETLKNHYTELGNVFKDIAEKHSSEIQKLAQESKNDKQQFAENIIKILAEELGMKGYEPKIEFIDTQGADGLANWPKGTIQIGKNVNNAKTLVEIISHEFTHMLQYRDILAQYGEQGLREVIMNDKGIPAAKKESTLKEILTSPFTAKLLENYDILQKSEVGSLNEYLKRIYKDEFANPIAPDKNIQIYVNQTTEREAYHLGSEQLGNNVEGVAQEWLIPEEKSNIEGLRGEINGSKYFIDEYGQIHRNVPAGISSKMTDAEFQIIGQKLCERENGEVSSAAKALLQTIKNSELCNVANDRNNFIIEIFEQISRDSSGKILSEEILDYAKELINCIPTGKDSILLSNTDSTIKNIINLRLKYSTPIATRQIIDATKKLLSNPTVRNGVVYDIINACIEGSQETEYTFNQKAFDSIYKMFEQKIESRKNDNGFSYSLIISEIAQNATRYEKDANGHYIKQFDDIGFRIGTLLLESDTRGDYVHYNLTNEVDLSNIDKLAQDYIIQKVEKSYFQSTKEISEFNDRTYKFETQTVYDKYAEPLRKLCTVGGKLDVQNCFAVDYMINNLGIPKGDVVKMLEIYRNQDGILNTTILHLIKNEKNDYEKTGVLATLQKLNQLGILYGQDGKVDQEVLDILKSSPNVRAMTYRDDYYSKLDDKHYSYDISAHYLSNGTIDFEKLKFVESEIGELIKILNLECNNATNRCIICNLYNTIKANPQMSAQILEAAKKCSSFGLFEALDLNGKRIELKTLNYYASLPTELYELIKENRWLLPYIKGETPSKNDNWSAQNLLTQEHKAVLAKYGYDIDYIIKAKENQFNKKSEISPEAQSRFENTLEGLDDILLNSDVNEGIQLEYPRESFEKDIIDATKNLPLERANDILNLYGLTLKDGKIEGVICTPQIEVPKDFLTLDKKIKQCIERFLNNKVLTEDPSLNTVYTALTHDFPEFSMLVGKIDAAGQRVEVTVLKQMQKLLNNPEYEALPKKEQKMAKLVLLFRAFKDIDSTPNIIEKSFTVDNDGVAIKTKHKRYKNSDYAWAILERFSFSDEEKYAITDLVAHSGWSNEFNDGVVDIGIAREYETEWIAHNGVKDYPDINPENNANKVAVNTRFGTLRLSKLIEDVINPNNNIDIRAIEAAQKKVYQNMQKINSVTAEDLEPYWETLIIDGVECQVIDLRKIKLPDDFYLMGHFTEHGVEYLYDLLSNKNDKVFFSNSLIKPDAAKTFAGRTEGIISEFDSRNIAETSHNNLDSGFGKSYNDFVETISGTGTREIASLVKKQLSLTDEEYGILMEQINGKRFNELEDYYNINDRYISKEEIISSHNTAYENLLNSKGEQNEITILSPTPIALVYSASKTPGGACPFNMEKIPLKRIIIFP